MRPSLQESRFPYGPAIVFVCFLSWFYLPGDEFVFFNTGIEPNWYSWDVFISYYYYIVVSVLIITILVASRTHWSILIGKQLPHSEIPAALQLTAFLYIFSVAAAYILFIPLSYLSPAFVQWWYLDLPPSIYYESGSYPIVANIMRFISLVLVAPIVEEILFRGLLLRIWVKKWGLLGAVFLSSLVFGALHADPIGACAFGIGMSILYLRTQSLYLPILCHIVNNVVAWMHEAGYIYFYGPEYEYTIDTLREEWYVGLLTLIISLVWLVRFLSRPAQSREWKLPYT